MIEAPLIVLGGLLGSAHCLGMCGGFVLTLSVRGRRTMTELQRQSIYAAGRISTYTVAGATAGFVGLRLTHWLPSAARAQGWLCILAGACLVVQGAVEAGLWRRRYRNSSDCLGPSMFGALWQATRWHSTFLAGVINGLLPCGLVYAFLALAMSSGGLWTGAATMALFGLGTAPALILFGAGGGCLSQRLRRQIVTLAAWCVLATGAVSMVRGVSHLAVSSPEDVSTACPLCSAP